MSPRKSPKRPISENAGPENPRSPFRGQEFRGKIPGPVLGVICLGWSAKYRGRATARKPPKE